MTRILWQTLGLTALALGGIGVVLPILPTTPFMILAAFAFGKSSPRLRARLEAHRVFGPAIRDWEAHGAIHRRYKITACVVMALVFLGSVVAGLRPAILLIQGVCMGAAALFVVTRPGGGPAR